MKQVVADKLVKKRLCGGIMSRPKLKKETLTEIITKSFKEAVASLETQLGSSAVLMDKVHVEYQHPIGKIAAFRQLFNVGPLHIWS
jgi:penicillin amidase